MAKQPGRHSGKQPKGIPPKGDRWLGGSHRDRDGCACSYQRAGEAVRRGQVRLALRFVRMDVKARLHLI